MIGALPWDPPAERPGWLDEIDRPIVLVTTSSEYQADGALVRAALDGLRDEPFEVVATMPAGIQGLGTLPANARVLDFVPHRHVLDRTVVAVTHGGMGATQKALARGIPVCVVPFGRDQLEVAMRGRGQRQRHPAAGEEARRRSPADRCPGGHGLHRGCAPRGRGLPRDRWRVRRGGHHRGAVRARRGARAQLIAAARRPAAGA